MAMCRIVAAAGVCALLLGGAPAAPAGAQEPGPETLPPPLMAPPGEIVPPGREDDPGTAAVYEAFAVGGFEGLVVELVNRERLANGGLPPLKGVEELLDPSETHSFNMADRDFFAHCDVDTKKSPFQRMNDAGYFFSTASENIAAGQANPEAVMNVWMNSPGHRANILSTAFYEMGAGYHEQGNDQADVRVDQNGDCNADGFGFGPYFRYWTQNFGRRSGVYPLVINRESVDTACAELRLYVYGPPGAAQMRFSNDGSTWSAWQPYSPNAQWTIPDGSASPAAVYSQVTNGTTYDAEDSIFLDAGFPATSNLVLSSQYVNHVVTYRACDTISAGDGYVVGPSGDVTFRAGRRVVLRDGFAVETGGTFRAVVDPFL